MRNTEPAIDREKFLEQFQGLEELAQHAVNSFLESLPKLTQAIGLAIDKKNPLELQIAAHTLKGAVSNFFAEPSKVLAWQLEQLGQGKDLEKAKSIFEELKSELERLKIALLEFATTRK